MAAITEKEFRVALREHALKAGDYLNTKYIGIPHQLPPVVKDSHFAPPDEDCDDRYVAGDHDYHACVSLIDGMTYTGHQQAQVRTLAERYLDKEFGRNWMAEVLCEMFAGHRIDDPEFRKLNESQSLAIAWDDLWPEVDAVLRLTGRCVGSEEGYVNIDDEAMIEESEAIAAGMVIEDGRVVSYEGGADA